MVEYITADGLFSIDLALRPPPALEQSAQPAAAAINAQIHANGSGQSSSVSSGSSKGSIRVAAELDAGEGPNGAQEHQVRTRGKAPKVDVIASFLKL